MSHIDTAMERLNLEKLLKVNAIIQKVSQSMVYTQTLNVSLSVPRYLKQKLVKKNVKKVSTKKHPTFIELILAVSSHSQMVLANFSNCSCTHTVKLRTLNFFFEEPSLADQLQI
jgi:hypothetical protein